MACNVNLDNKEGDLEMISSVWQSITAFVYSVLQALVNVLPDSPFVIMGQTPQIQQILGWVNWVIPIDFIVSTMIPWLSAIVIYYIYSAIMRWAKAID